MPYDSLLLAPRGGTSAKQGWYKTSLYKVGTVTCFFLRFSSKFADRQSESFAVSEWNKCTNTCVTWLIQRLIKKILDSIFQLLWIILCKLVQGFSPFFSVWVETGRSNGSYRDPLDSASGEFHYNRSHLSNFDKQWKSTQKNKKPDWQG